MATLTAITGELDVRLRLAIEATADFDNATQDIIKSLARRLSVGTGADQANAAWADSRTLSASASETLDLQSLTNGLGQTVTFTKIKWLLFVNTTTGSGAVVGGAAANVWAAHVGDDTDTNTVPAAGILLLADNGSTGYAVDATNKNLKILNSSGAASLTYDLFIVGVGT